MVLPKDVKIINAQQARAARVVLGLSAVRLARASGVSASSIRRVEDGPDAVTIDLLVRLQSFYEKEGLGFLWEAEKCGLIWPLRLPREKS